MDQEFRTELPEVFEPLSDDYGHIAAIIAALTTERELATRADLAEDLVRTSAVVEDSKDQAIYPYLDEVDSPLAQQMRGSARSLGEAMIPIYQAVRHIVPIDVHKPDPEGFEHDVDRLVAQVTRHLALERTQLLPVLDRLREDQRAQLKQELDTARHHALEHPLPPHNRIARWLTRIEEHIDRVQDTSTQYRPAKGRLAS